ncbi:hypothetical protein O6H91_23G029800 [Diphasiastrum complanatum]|uniref:Uncharacterized protein n=1 Tax=Diphasiastrum complanatum TaxID=34168 RepID=A0ACC2A9A3_DIPCM|nr:hypothetical protein O6H91_23G029800 [Diphasiastrum complanatum]
MGRSTKPHSNWYASNRKLLSFFRVFKNLALIWRHPIATLCILLFLLLLFITPMQTIIRFFSPLIVCTLLCMVAFISFGSLMEKNENQTSHIQVGDQIAALDVLGLGEGWAPYNGFQSHSRFTKDGDLNFLDVKVKSKTYVQTRNEIFGVDQLEEDGDYQSDRSLKKEIGLSSLTDSKTHVQIENDFAGMGGQERQAGWASPIHDGLQSATSKLKLDRSLSSLAEPVMERESKTHVKFEDDSATVDEKGGDEDWASQMHDGLHSDTDRREEDGQSTLTEEMNENKNHVQIEDGYSSLTEGMKEDKSLVQVEDASDGSDERGQDREWDSQMFNGFQQDSNIKPDDGLGSVMDTNEIETEIQTEEAAGMDVVSDFDQEFYDTNEFDDSNFTHEDDPNQEAGSEVQINGLGVLDRDPNLAVQLYNVSQADGNPKHESELKQKIDSEVQLEDKINGVDVLGHDPNLAIELFDGSQSDSNPKHESEFMPEIDSEIQMGDKINAMDVLGHDPNLAVELYNENPKQESEFKQEIDSEMQIGDKINGMDVLGHDENLAAELDHELHSRNNLKQADDPNPVPQKWRDWVRGVETDGLSIWTSEKDIFKNADESTMCTNFGQEITGGSGPSRRYK